MDLLRKKGHREVRLIWHDKAWRAFPTGGGVIGIGASAEGALANLVERLSPAKADLTVSDTNKQEGSPHGG
jgi:hypothetical protein